MLKLLVFAALFGFTYGYPSYAENIPNGKNVPHPCKPNYLWKGVGHENILGGGVRNPFGQDFEANGKKWDECLCKTDSDGDGKTNGEELGDPDCVWTLGKAPPTTIGLSHPGVCDPIDSDLCKAKNWDIDCSIPEFTCDALDNDADVRSHTVHLNETAVPAEETTYMCQMVELPDDGDYHIIAMEPAIVNHNVAHHIILYGCPEENVDEVKNQFSNPVQCGMNTFLCSQMIALWTVGISGECFPEEFGFHIGQSGFKVAILEIHWNNPEEKTYYVDSSGLTLYYTPNQRTYSASTIFIGPLYLELPPGQKEVIQEGHCPAECTNHMFDENIKIAKIYPHMHYAGRGMEVKHKRNGITLRTLMDIDDYNYDNPEGIPYDPPVEVMPGDEITVQCTFETTNHAEFVFFGEATSDEMCLAVVIYYPKQVNESGCYVMNEVGWCGKTVGHHIAGDCWNSIQEFYENDLEGIWQRLGESCDPTGWECWHGCSEAIAEVRSHICLQENIDHIVLQALTSSDDVSLDFARMMASCDDRPVYVQPDDSHSHEKSFLCDDVVGAANGIAVHVLAFVFSVFGTLLFSANIITVA